MKEGYPMYFKTYKPATLADNSARARAAHILNAVARHTNVFDPSFEDYANYIYEKKLTFRDRILIIGEEESWLEELKAEWDNLMELVKESKKPTCATKGHFAYFLIFNDGFVKNGETNNIASRYSQLSSEHDGINHMWYIELNNEEERKLAQHAVHNVFDHSRAMSRAMGKQDYYQSELETAHRFMTTHKGQIWRAIMNAIGEE